MGIFKYFSDKKRERLFDDSVAAEVARRQAVNARNQRNEAINVAINSGEYDKNGLRKKKK